MKLEQGCKVSSHPSKQKNHILYQDEPKLLFCETASSLDKIFDYHNAKTGWKTHSEVSL